MKNVIGKRIIDVLVLSILIFILLVLFNIRNNPAIFLHIKTSLLTGLIVTSLFYILISTRYKALNIIKIASVFLCMVAGVSLTFWDWICLVPDTSKLEALEAHDMQYACGDWNDDMKVTAIDNFEFSSLIEQDIDPVLYLGKRDISTYLAEDATQIQKDVKLKGYFGLFNNSGCDKSATRFWVVEIKRLNGTLLYKK